MFLSETNKHLCSIKVSDVHTFSILQSSAGLYKTRIRRSGNDVFSDRSNTRVWLINPSVVEHVKSRHGRRGYFWGESYVAPPPLGAVTSLDSQLPLARVVQRQQVQIGHAPPGRRPVVHLHQRLVVPQHLHRGHVAVQAEQVEHAVTVDGNTVQPVDQQYPVGPARRTTDPSRRRRVAARQSDRLVRRPPLGAPGPAPPVDFNTCEQPVKCPRAEPFFCGSRAVPHLVSFPTVNFPGSARVLPQGCPTFWQYRATPCEQELVVGHIRFSMTIIIIIINRFCDFYHGK